MCPIHARERCLENMESVYFAVMLHDSTGEAERPAVSSCYCGLDSTLADREDRPLLRVPAHPEEDRGGYVR